MVAPSPLTRSEDDRRELIAWAADCAERLLPVFHAVRPADPRPREALDGARAFARGELRIGEARKLAVACHAAAREAGDPAATAAARVCGHTIAVAHMASHARGVPYYSPAALAGAGDEARERELEWQRARLPERFVAYVYDRAPE